MKTIRGCSIIILTVFFLSMLILMSACGDFQKGREIATYVSNFREIQNWAIAVESYYSKNGKYPEANSIEALMEILSPYNDKRLRCLDSWDEEYLIEFTNDAYLITSKGKDRIGTHGFGGALKSEDYNDSITLKNGYFVQYSNKSSKTIKNIEDEIFEKRAR